MTNIPQAHERMVRGIAHRLARHLPAHVDVDDLVQAGWEGYVQALSRYAGTHAASFETYAGHRVLGAMRDEMRREDWLPRYARRGGAWFELVEFDEEADERTAPDVEAETEHHERARALWSTVDALPNRLRDLIRSRYIDDESWRSIAERFDVSENRVWQLHADAIRRLRWMLARCRTGQVAQAGTARLEDIAMRPRREQC